MKNKLDHNITYNPIITDGLAHIEKLYQQGLYHLAEKEAMDLLQINPFEDRVLFTLALIKYKTYQIEACKFLLEKAIAQHAHELYLHNLAAIHNDQGNYNKALELSFKALSINNTHLLSLKNIASVYFKQHNLEKALEYYTTITELYPQDEESKVFITIIKDNDKTTNLPSDYIIKLFNDYAGSFDHHLNNILEYKTPQIMASLLTKHLYNFINYYEIEALDLGCGTGLFADNLIKQFPQQKFNITGVDLSDKMVEIAKYKKIYNKLVVREINAFLQQGHKHYNLISAADVLAYFGDLDLLFNLISQRMRSKDLFIFSAELNDNQKDFELIVNNMRFKHNIQYLSSLINKYKLKIIDQKEDSLRKNNYQDVRGIIFLTQKD